MALKQVIEIYEPLDSAEVCGQDVISLFKERGLQELTSDTVEGEKGSADFVKLVLPGSHGREKGGPVPTLGIIGRLGGIGPRGLTAKASAYALATRVSTRDCPAEFSLILPQSLRQGRVCL